MKQTLRRSEPFAAAGFALATLVTGCTGQSGSALPNGHTAGGTSQVAAQIPLTKFKSIEYTQGITPSSNPRGITPGFAQWLWFTQPGSNQIGHINARGLVSEFTAATNGVNNIVTGPDGNIWFTESGADVIGRMTPKGKIKIFRVGNEAYGPFDICNGADGNLWFTFRSPSANAIGRITTAGAVTLFTNGLTPGDVAVHDITEGSDGNVWFTEEFNNRIGSITPSGTIAEYANGISSNAGLVDISDGPDGNVWFTENATNKIGRITPGGTVTEFSGFSPQAGPGSITLADGSLWVTEAGYSKVASVSTSGAVTEYAIPVALASDIAQGPNGTLWITDYSGNGVVKATP